MESGNGDVTFNIAFLEGTTDIPVDESVLGGKKIGTNATVGEWVVHPAFNFGGTPLEGIWVAKYEASSSNPSAENGGGNDVNLQVNIKPDVASWRNINVSNIFSVCQNMKDEKGALEGSSKADSHMMKNVEWGAVAYLSQSQYGKGEQVWNNPSSSSKTGQAGFSADDAKVSSTESYLTPNGVQASTTGNPYGIYDMAGESWEYVAAYVDNSSAKNSTYITALREADAKYKDVYTAASGDTQQANYDANSSKYGDAVYETSKQGTGDSSWQKDRSNFPSSSNPVFQRGGHWYDSTNAGLFCFTSGGDGGYSGHSFRPVCLGLE